MREKVEYVYEKGEKKTSKPMTRLGSTGSRLMMMSLRSAPNINMMEQEEKKNRGEREQKQGEKKGLIKCSKKLRVGGITLEKLNLIVSNT